MSSESDNEEVELYCICRSSDIERFMIMCDECEQWFHGDCINISEKESRYIKYFYCQSCQSLNPLLKIKYKSKHKQREEKEAFEQKKHKSKKSKLSRDVVEKEKKKKRHFENTSSAKSGHQFASDSKYRIPSKKGKYETDQRWRPDTIASKKSNKEENIAIKSSNYGTEDKNKEKNSSKNKVGFSSEDATRQKTPKLQDKLKFFPKIPKKVEASSENSVIDVEGFSPSIPLKAKPKKTACGDNMCDNCIRTENCGVCDVCHDIEKYGLKYSVDTCRLRRCLEEDSDSLPKKKIKKEARSNPQMPTVPKAEWKDSQDRLLNLEKNKNKSRKRDDRSYDKSPEPQRLEPEVEFIPLDAVQCLGPRCTKVAKKASKYCSEDCGRLLARQRLMEILPKQIDAWHNTPTVANEVAKEELERIRKRMIYARKELESLENKFQQLEQIIETGKRLSTISHHSSTHDDVDNTDTDRQISCVVCGQDIYARSAVKHMDRCYTKIEAQMSFGSVYPTRIEGSQRLFCDVFNERQQTYCKRLQVLCPEHAKEPKVGEQEVCGCPLSCDIYERNIPTKPAHFCRLQKRKCTKHYRWETMYRAEVDLQRIRQWLKIDEIFEEERKIKTAMSNRAGVISLLLHPTTAHDPSCVDMRTKPTLTKAPAYRLMI